MPNLRVLPLRQKILITLTIVVGLFLFISSVFGLLLPDTLNQLIWFYGIGVPICLLVFDTIIDLNNSVIFGIWMIISIVIYIVSLTTYNSDVFVMHRSGSFDANVPINSLISGHSTSSLKALLIFLIVYWLLNKLLNKKGLFVINTFRQTGWYHNIAQRKITRLDVLTNVILGIIIIAAGLFGH